MKQYTFSKAHHFGALRFRMFFRGILCDFQVEAQIYVHIFSANGLACWFGAFGGLGFESGFYKGIQGIQTTKRPKPTINH